jgi:metal-responsive CopG/Arc/MetJ family transcriptional regulator
MEIDNLKGRTKKKVTYSIDAKLLEQFEFMVPLKLRSAAIEQLIREWLQ